MLKNQIIHWQVPGGGKKNKTEKPVSKKNLFVDADVYFFIIYCFLHLDLRRQFISETNIFVFIFY